MLLRFGPYSLDRPPLSKADLKEIGISEKLVFSYAIAFIEYLLPVRIEKPLHAADIAKHFGWKRDANIKKLRRYWWYLGVPVGSICVGKSEKDGYYWPRNAAEFKPTMDQYEARFYALARTRTHLEYCQITADILLQQLRGIPIEVIQSELMFELEMRA